jgi:hypothetical protein
LSTSQVFQSNSGNWTFHIGLIHGGIFSPKGFRQDRLDSPNSLNETDDLRGCGTLQGVAEMKRLCIIFALLL